MMFKPIPIIIVAGLILLLIIGRTIRSLRTRDPLLGAQTQSSPPYAGSYQERAPVAPVAMLPPEFEAQVRALIAEGRKIEAIKLTRNATHLGLKESKDLVESLERSPHAY